MISMLLANNGSISRQMFDVFLAHVYVFHLSYPHKLFVLSVRPECIVLSGRGKKGSHIDNFLFLLCFFFFFFGKSGLSFHWRCLQKNEMANALFWRKDLPNAWKKGLEFQWIMSQKPVWMMKERKKNFPKCHLLMFSFIRLTRNPAGLGGSVGCALDWWSGGWGCDRGFSLRFYHEVAK